VRPQPEYAASCSAALRCQPGPGPLAVWQRSHDVVGMRSRQRAAQGVCFLTGKGCPVSGNVDVCVTRASAMQESEYAAWVLVNGYALNHATVSVHRLQGFRWVCRGLPAHCEC